MLTFLSFERWSYNYTVKILFFSTKQYSVERPHFNEIQTVHLYETMHVFELDISLQ